MSRGLVRAAVLVLHSRQAWIEAVGLLMSLLSMEMNLAIVLLSFICPSYGYF